MVGGEDKLNAKLKVYLKKIFCKLAELWNLV
jgi:hypothetical protein